MNPKRNVFNRLQHTQATKTGYGTCQRNCSYTISVFLANVLLHDIRHLLRQDTDWPYSQNDREMQSTLDKGKGKGHMQG